MGLHAGLHADIEVSDLGGIPQIAHWHGESLDERTKGADGRVRSLGDFGYLEVRAVGLPDAPYVEDHHLLAEGRYERLEIGLRIDIKINVQKMSRCEVASVYNHAPALNLNRTILHHREPAALEQPLPL